MLADLREYEEFDDPERSCGCVAALLFWAGVVLLILVAGFFATACSQADEEAPQRPVDLPGGEPAWIIEVKDEEGEIVSRELVVGEAETAQRTLELAHEHGAEYEVIVAPVGPTGRV